MADGQEFVRILCLERSPVGDLGDVAERLPAWRTSRLGIGVAFEAAAALAARVDGVDRDAEARGDLRRLARGPARTRRRYVVLAVAEQHHYLAAARPSGVQTVKAFS